MALREILSTQAASAAVVTPALDVEEVPPACDAVGDLNLTSSSKGRGFDLDLNAGLEEETLDFQSVKEEVPDTRNGTHANNWNGCQSTPDIKPSWIASQGADINIEAGTVVVKPELDLNQLDLNLEVRDEPFREEPKMVKLEPREIPYAENVERRIDTSVKVENCSNAIRPFLNIPKDSRASKLLLSARESWAANLEFLQDCTIRLLCVFSLDRYVCLTIFGTSFSLPEGLLVFFKCHRLLLEFPTRLCCLNEILILCRVVKCILTYYFRKLTYCG